MPKLPDVLSLGQRPAPAAPSGVASVPNAGAAESALAKSGDEVARVGTELGEQMAKAQARVRSRADAIERVRAYGAFSEEASAELLKRSTEQDFTRPEAMVEFGKFLRERQQKIISEHAGSEESRLQLLERLESERFKIVGQASKMATEQQRKLMADAIGGKVRGYSSQAYDNPAGIVQAFNSLESDINDMKDGLEPHEERSFRQNGREQIVKSALEGFIDRGQIEEAERLLQEVPGINEVLGEDASRSLRGRITLARAKESEGANAGLKVRAELRAALGREPTEDELQQKLGVAGKAEKLVAISDPTSPTGERLVPESEAVGKPAPGRQPIVTITQMGEQAVAKELGKLDAERVLKLENDAQEAFRTMAEVDRMEAAMASGRFTTGAFADALVFIGRLGERVGVAEQIKDMVGEAATADTLDAASNRIAVAQAQKLGRITNMSLQFIRDSLPNLTRTPGGNRILLEVMRRTSEREIQIAALADEMISRYGTLRPKDAPTFFQRMRDLEEKDPVITPELRQKIMSESEKAPKTWRDVLKDAVKQAPPEGYAPPAGWTFQRMDGDRPVIKKGGVEVRGPAIKQPKAK